MHIIFCIYINEETQRNQYEGYVSFISGIISFTRLSL
jgi:hypothetical protein